MGVEAHNLFIALIIFVNEIFTQIFLLNVNFKKINKKNSKNRLS